MVHFYAMDRVDVVRGLYEAYVKGDRGAVEPLLAEDFTFSSPPDPRLDREQYWERCWPNAQWIEGFDFVRLIEHGDEVVVTYESTKTDGSRFRNTEVTTFAGDRIVRQEVYFGWDLPAAATGER
jgi:ketosteroid isomerase-like protein